MVKKAFVLAAGLGSRLGNLTTKIPKALIKVNGKTMLQTTIEKLVAAGVSEIVVNIHHFGELIIEHLEQNNNFGCNVKISDERNKLLDTGGALINARSFFSTNETILVHNVDIISAVDLQEMYRYHTAKNSDITLSIRDRSTNRKLMFDKGMRLKGWKNKTSGETKWAGAAENDLKEFAFSGIYLISTKCIDQISLTGAFSVVDAWIELSKFYLVTGYPDDSSYWFDLGTSEKINEAEEYIKQNDLG